MADRQATRFRKDKDHGIRASGSRSQSWTRANSANAISHLESARQCYFPKLGNSEVGIQVVTGPDGEYLHTDRDQMSRNDLDDLVDR